MRLDVWTAAVAFSVFPQETLSEFAVAGRCQEGSLDAGVFRVRPPCPSSSSCRGNSNGDVAATAMDRNIAKQHEAGPPRTSSEATQSKHVAPAAAAAAAAAATAGRAGEAEASRAAEATAAGTPMAEGATRFERGGAAVTESRGRGRGMPSVTLKLAMDRNGAVDDMSEGPKRFTSQASLDAVHRIRRDCEAVLVGVGTVVRDDPSLTVRRVPLNEGQTRQPTRVVLDRTLRLTGAQAWQNPRAILRDGHSSLVFYSAGCEDTEARAAELKAGVKRSRAAVSDSSGETKPDTTHQKSSPVDFVGLPVQRPGAGVDLSGVLEALYERGIDHVLVEGGPSVARGFLSERLVDRAIIIRAPMEFSRPIPSDIATDTLRRAGLELVGCTKWGDDEAECWTRPGLGWPGGGVGSWP
ncbi:unnamed protein product [Ectocarpus sp. 12 AP-2014]